MVCPLLGRFGSTRKRGGTRITCATKHGKSSDSLSPDKPSKRTRKIGWESPCTDRWKSLRLENAFSWNQRDTYRRYIEDKYMCVCACVCMCSSYNRFSTHNELAMRERFEFGCFRVTHQLSNLLSLFPVTMIYS